MKKRIFEVVEMKDVPIPEGKFSVPVVFDSGAITEMFAFDVKPGYKYLRESEQYVFTEKELVELLREAWGFGKKNLPFYSIDDFRNDKGLTTNQQPHERH